jgi:predicted acylesterase/phospholipase RssA
MKALVTSGGGAKGAFSVGALKTLQQHGFGNFDIISGTSTGSLIAALAAVGNYQSLEQEYKNIQNTDILSQDNILRNLSLGRPYLYSTLPLQNKIGQFITDDVYRQIIDSQKYVCFTAISLHTGRRTVFATRTFIPQGDYDVVEITSGEMLRRAVLASSNQAAFLEPVKIEINGKIQQFVDGGNRDVLPVRPAIDLGATEIFALSNNPLEINPVQEEYKDLLKVLMRAIAIFIQDIRNNDYAELDRYTGGKVFKIQPDRELDTNNPTGLNFNKNDMLLWMRFGELAAKEVLKKNHLIDPLIA